MSNQDDGQENFCKEYGESCLSDDTGQKEKYRNFPKKATNSEAGDHYSKGKNPNMYCRQFPDGSFELWDYGKKPRYCFRHAGGHHETHLKNGTSYAFHPGAKMELAKTNVVSTVGGSHDKQIEKGDRNNTGEQGGYYAGAGEGGHGMIAAGPMASMSQSTASYNIAAIGNIKLSTHEGSCAMGSGDDGGKYKCYVHVRKDGGVTLKTKGGDMNMMVEGGNFKAAVKGSGRQSQFTMGKDGNISMNGQGDMSLSTAGKMAFAASEYKWQPGNGAPRTDQPPGNQTTLAKEKAFSDAQYTAKTNSNPTESMICPFGQRWDEKLMKCVIKEEILCPNGQTWDFNLNKCVIDPNQAQANTGN